MKKTVALKEILKLIDKEFDYGQDDEMIGLMEESSIAEKDKHLMEPRYFNRLLNYYAKIHNVDHYDQIIKVEGQGTKGTKYNYDDIMRFLHDPKIRNRIEKVIQKKTVVGPLGLVPRCISHKYFEMLSTGGKFVIDVDCGYSPYEIELFSVPEDILFKVKVEKEGIIKDLQDKLEIEQNELKCIINEIKSRGLPV